MPDKSVTVGNRQMRHSFVHQLGQSLFADLQKNATSFRIENFEVGIVPVVISDKFGGHDAKSFIDSPLATCVH